MGSLDSIKRLIDTKIYRILKLLVYNKKKKFQLNTISQQTKVPIASVFRIVKKLVKFSIVSSVKKGKLGVYKFNKLDKKLLIKLIDPKKYGILKLFLDNKDELFHLDKISSKTNVSLASTFRIVNKLCKMNVIDVVRVGKFRLYRLKKRFRW